MKTNFKLLSAIIFLSITSCSKKEQQIVNTNESNAVTESIKPTKVFKPEKTLISHLAKTQYYRWYQLYERDMNDKRIANQLEILTDDVTLKSASGVINGKKNYVPILPLYKGWQNAHHVQQVSVKELDSNKLQLEADIRYQNILPNGQKRNYTAHYSTELRKMNTALPQFSLIAITPTGNTNDTFVDTYNENRAKSLMHYWLSLMEKLDGKVDPFKEILTTNFQLNMSEGCQLNNLSKLNIWLQGISKTLTQSNHYPENFSIKTISANEWEMTVLFDWYGITKNGKKLTTKTKHIWRIINNLDDRFAKIKGINVTQIEPLQVIE